MFINSVGFNSIGQGRPGPGMSSIGRFGNEKFVNTEASFLPNALSERQIPAMISTHPLNRCTKTGMLQYLMVGRGGGWPIELAVLLH
jgi:hypothetical protein